MNGDTVNGNKINTSKTSGESFFSKLRAGITYVESGVKEVQQAVGDDFGRTQPSDDDLAKVKKFELDLRSTYVSNLFKETN